MSTTRRGKGQLRLDKITPAKARQLAARAHGQQENPNAEPQKVYSDTVPF